jgi:hypothetical protein
MRSWAAIDKTPAAVEHLTDELLLLQPSDVHLDRLTLVRARTQQTRPGKRTAPTQSPPQQHYAKYIQYITRRRPLPDRTHDANNYALGNHRLKPVLK